MFVHQNMPGQYRELVQWMAEQGGHRIYFLTQRLNAAKIAGVETRVYKTHYVPKKDAYGLSKVWEEATGAGFGAVLAAKQIEREEGFKPDIIVGHVGWGELTFFKQLWPDVPIIGFFEYYYRLHGGPVNFDPEEPVNEHTPFLLQARNAVPNANITTVDRGLSPTKWQRDCFPPEMHNKIYVCHDGIHTDKLLPDHKAKLKLGRLEKLVGRGDEIVTYMARNLERPQDFAHLGPAARQHVIAEYDFLTKCLPEHIAEMNALLPKDKQITMPVV